MTITLSLINYFERIFLRRTSVRVWNVNIALAAIFIGRDSVCLTARHADNVASCMHATGHPESFIYGKKNEEAQGHEISFQYFDLF